MTVSILFPLGAGGNFIKDILSTLDDFSCFDYDGNLITHSQDKVKLLADYYSSAIGAS